MLLPNVYAQNGGTYTRTPVYTSNHAEKHLPTILSTNAREWTILKNCNLYY